MSFFLFFLRRTFRSTLPRVCFPSAGNAVARFRHNFQADCISKTTYCKIPWKYSGEIFFFFFFMSQTHFLHLRVAYVLLDFIQIFLFAKTTRSWWLRSASFKKNNIKTTLGLKRWPWQVTLWCCCSTSTENVHRASKGQREFSPRWASIGVCCSTRVWPLGATLTQFNRALIC